MTEGLCHCGCGNITNVAKYDNPSRGAKKGEHRKYLPNHFHPGTKPKPIRYRVNTQTGCWEWLLAKSDQGYGITWENSKRVYAHRFYFELYKGQVPEGLELDHLCKNRGCVNPEHLEHVTRAENTRRGSSTKLSKEQVTEIKRLHTKLGFGSRRLARIFKMSRSAVYRIIKETGWKGV